MKLFNSGARGSVRRRRLLFGAVVMGIALFGTQTPGPASATGSHVLIQGTGSSWAQNAVDQWDADVLAKGLQVVFTGSGSAQGRKDFSYYNDDFAVSDIGFQGTDPLTGTSDTSNGRAYAYLPVAAGGTSFPYQLNFGGKAIVNLRLSGQTLSKIFTNQITMWNDPAIVADNNGTTGLPAIAIVPVVHSEGSGSTAQFTAWMNDQYPAIWQQYCGCKGLTEYFPTKSGTNMIAQNGSDGVMNFVSSAAANGAIAYDEYSYPLAQGTPAAKIENKAGYYTLPSQYNVAVALTKAVINTDKSSPNYLLQDLHGVYLNSDQRAYPLSSYSYMIIPTSPTDKKMTTAKRQTLADYLSYSICTGQGELGPIGYSSLPVNLVTAGFSQVAKLKQADNGVDISQAAISTCHNPTFIPGQPNVNCLAKIAPVPPPCDKSGSGPCSGQGSLGAPNGNCTGAASGARPPSGSTTGTGTGTGTGPKSGPSSGPNPGGTTGTGVTGIGTSTGTGGAPGTIDPATGQLVSGTSTGTANAADLVAVPADLAASGQSSSGTLGIFIVLEIALLLIAPPMLVVYFRRRRASA